MSPAPPRAPDAERDAEKIVIAHRGASGYLPEHTLAAKALAHGMGAHYIEQDVVLTADDVPIVVHDHWLDTVTDVAARFPSRARPDGRFYAIDFSLAEVRSLRATERLARGTDEPVYPGRFPPGASSFSVPTLAEEIELIQGLNRTMVRTAGIYPEIKSPALHRAAGRDVSAIVIALLASYGYASRTDPLFLQCFDWDETRRIRGALGFEGRLIQLIGENAWRMDGSTDHDALRTEAGLAAIAAVADGIGAWLPQLVRGIDDRGRAISTGLLETAKAHGLAVHAYTLRADALPDYARSLEHALDLVLYDLGADGVFTDHPDRAVTHVERRAAGAP